MQMILAVGVGGAIGAVSRYLMALAIFRALGPGFPWGTLAINVLGSLLMGVLAELLALRFSLPHPMQAFFLTGVLGGFTTFSTFSLDAVTLMARGQSGAAFLYIGGSVILSLAALFAGLAITRSLISGL
ncbi:fluoride efflux transporter CrcB [Govanella unica]|uniref:Fluoride-specific ion channel FluC n=1 Tax=Govanella unica TaxID=2975056 RepID=A0A9X3Z6M5_9PROT|nr:fluoride efflux transporter CrcB [Govania unica]MDA5193084.1 fluoride efflux transporter CrcB [Govania unica]